MSKMKHLLRKLHIGGGFHGHHHGMASEPRPVIDTPPPQTTSLPSPSSSASALAITRAVESAGNSREFNFFEEELQMQLALAISVSDPDTREDTETAQIKAAKQISLGCAPCETFVESLSLRYWCYDFVSYDEKVMDGFYDVCAVTSKSGVQGKIPGLLDLQAISVSDNNVDYEVIIVNRAIDPALHQLEERVYAIYLEYQVLELFPIMGDLIQKIADLVVDRMGGPVSHADEMLERWTVRSYELYNSLNSVVLPLGRLDVGLSRHRALLFKVLADRLDLPCMLVKGSYYTGTDDGAVNLIKFNNGCEYIIDLMGAPGTLIPAEVSSDDPQNSGLDIRSSADDGETVRDFCPMLEKGTTGKLAVSPDLGHVAQGGSSDSMEASYLGIQSKGDEENLEKANQTNRFENEFGKLLPALCKSREDLSGNDGKVSEAQKMEVQDVSKCIVSAAKNPEFAQKLHAVFSERGAPRPAYLFVDMNTNDGKEMEMLEQIHLLNGEVDAGPQYNTDMLLSSNDQLLIPSTGVQSFLCPHYDNKQKYPSEDLEAKQLESSSTAIDTKQSLTSDTTSEEFVLVNCGTNAMNQTDDMALGLVSVSPSGIVVKSLYGEHSHESSVPSATNYYEGQYKEACVGGDGWFVKDKVGKVLDNIAKDKESTVRLMETANSGQPIGCSIQNKRICLMLGEVEDLEIPWEDLEIGERIGIGSYGEVYRADLNGTEVAVKKFMDQDISGDALVQFKCEVEIMLRLRHPNVVLFMGAVTRPPNLSILTEYLPRGSLYKLLHRPNNHLNEDRRMRMALDVAKGMNYLHVSHPTIVHRDLKTPNLLVDKNWVVKVCDFGLSRMKHSTFLSSKSTAGTPEWMAPEVLRNEPSNEKSDVYSFGVILWELATLRVPWTGMNSMQVVGAVGFQNRHLDITEEIDSTAAEIITECWHPDPQSRPSFGQLISRLRELQRLQCPAVQRSQTRPN